MKDLKVAFFLRPAGKLEPQQRIAPEPVYVRINLPVTKVNGKREYPKLIFPLKCNIKPKYFGLPSNNFNYNPVVIDKCKSQNSTFRDKQGKMYDAVNRTVRYYTIAQIIPTKKEFDEYLGKVLENKELDEPIETMTLYKYVEKYVTEITHASTRGEDGALDEKSLKRYDAILKIIRNFSTTATLNQFTDEVWFALWNHADSELLNRLGRKYAGDTLRNYQRTLNKMLKACVYYTIPYVPREEVVSKRKRIVSDKTKATIPEEYLIKLINHSFNGKGKINESLEEVRKYIIIACLTGQRIQTMKCDITTIQYNRDYDYQYVEFYQQKPDTYTYAPLFKAVLNLCNNGKFPVFKKSEKYYNDLMPEVLKAIGFPNAHYITSHNCRSTFTTILRDYLVPEEVVGYVTHPSKKNNSSNSAHIYNRGRKLSDSIVFFNESKDIWLRYPDTVYKY